MKQRIIVGLIAAVLLLILAITFSAGNIRVAEANEAISLLKTALVRIDVPQPGQIVHYSYTLSRRAPPASLEPADPYHLPYTKIWPAKEFEDTWLEIDAGGKTIRWRTQLRDAEGELLQDLMFDGAIEIDYFPANGKATKSPQQANDFRDNRAALIEDFLHNENLSRHESTSPEGRKILGVYTKAKQLGNVQNANSALLSFTSPFIADLQPVSLASRIDFDPTTLLPVGDAQVVWDQSGSEHIISYRTLSPPEILPTSQAKDVFRQDVPEEAFQDTQSTPFMVGASTDLATIASSVTYPIYIPHDTTGNLQLAAAVGAPLNQNRQTPQFLQGIEFAGALGLGIQSIYVNQENTARLSITQGPRAAMNSALQQTIPTWLNAEQIQIWVGNRQVAAWKLEGADTRHLRYVIELGEALLYMDSQGLQQDELLKLLQSFAPIQ